MKGFIMTGGLSANAKNKPCTQDAHIIEALRLQGAIPIAASNVPQMLLAMESSNNIWGQGENPWDRTRTVGGSSGGDAGAVAIKASPFSIGSDSMGSLRSPPAFNGVYSFQSTMRRISRIGRTNWVGSDVDTMKEFEPGLGPIGKCVDDIVLLLRSLYGHPLFHTDWKVVNIPFNVEKFEKVKNSRSLRIGYLIDETTFECPDAMKNVVKEVCDKLAAQGHHVEPFPVMNFSDLSVWVWSIVFAGTGADKLVTNAMQGEEPLPMHHLELTWKGKTPEEISAALADLRARGLSRYADFLSVYKQSTLPEFYAFVAKKERFMMDFYRHWTNCNFDVVISPTSLCPAQHRGDSSGYLCLPLIYTTFSNCIQLPSGVVPIRQVRPEEQEYHSKIDDKFTEIIKKTYSGAAGLPLAVQVIARPYEDEVALGVMKQVEDIFKWHRYAV
jgi:fatty acid amide hydrolase